MDLQAKLAELHKRTVDHREVLLTEEAAKTALVMRGEFRSLKARARLNTVASISMVRAG